MAIESYELRIGNFFHLTHRNGDVAMPDESTIFEITALGIGTVRAVSVGSVPAQIEKHCEFKYFDISPVKLTKKIIANFGFEHQVTYKIGRFEIWHSSYEDCFLFRYGHNQSLWLPHVHKLQNFYIDLESKQLKYNPK